MKTLTTLLCFAVLACAADARAQWDAAGQLALLNRNKAELSQWDRWYSAPAIDASAGRYWTPHLKTEFEIGTAGQGTIDGTDSTPVPGSSFPYLRYREHTFRETTVAATAFYQFRENQWIHPFVGAGVELVRERHVADPLAASTVRLSSVVPPLSTSAVPAIDTVAYSVRPLVTGGFKFYVSPRAFIRAEVRTSLAADRPLALQWRGGIGFDF